MIELTDSEFDYIYNFVKSNYGINLLKKRKLIEARLFSVLTEKGMTSFSQYLRLITVKDSPEVLKLIEKLTTNHTFFMRESDHFDYLKTTVFPEFIQDKSENILNIWSAGCSTGQEIYNINMIMRDFFSTSPTKPKTFSLATDISSKVLEKARKGIYSPEEIADIPENWKTRYFNFDTNNNSFHVNQDIIRSVKFEYLNLMENFNFLNKFDIIFCRNVMIYFDGNTKTLLAEKFYDALKPGGYLFIGHSETLQYHNTKLNYVKPSIYNKSR